MATFQYKAHREDQTPVEGQIEADDRESARRSLQEQGLVVSSIEQVDVGQARTDAPAAAPSPALAAEAERLALRRQFGRILRTGKPLAPALFAYAQELPHGRQRHRLEHIASQLEQGHDPPAELAVGQIDEEWMPLLSAGASSGDAGQILSGIIDESQRASDIRRQFAEAFAYPLLLLGFLSVFTLLFAWWLVPIFEGIFTDFDMELPELTCLVVRISAAMRWSGGLAILLPSLMLAAILAYLGFGPRSRQRNRILQQIPVFGSTIRLSDRARFIRCLADLMEAEVPVADALRISGRNTSQVALRQEANRLAIQMDSGRMELPGAPACYRLLPQTALHVLQGDADPRAAAQILRDLSWMYDQQSRHRLAWMSSITSPVFVVVLGTVVGVYVVALFIPLISLVQSLT